MSLPRTTEHLIGDNTKFRVGRLVYASVSADEERLGFGFPKDERAALPGCGLTGAADPLFGSGLEHPPGSLGACR